MWRILFRVDSDNIEEFEAARKVWGKDVVTRFRTDIVSGDRVIGRYSVMPFFHDLEDELHYRQAHLVHSASQYQWIASMAWYEPLSVLTPRTWFDVGWATVPDAEYGWVVKGRKTSRKFKWSTHMYAPTREALADVMRRCWEDPLLAEQGLVVREYVPLVTYEVGVNGVPVTNEWRCFFWGEKLLASGYYWAQADEPPFDSATSAPREALELARRAARIVAEQGLTFFVVDVGERAMSPGSIKGNGWTVIEINSGQMADLCTIDAVHFYERLREHV